MPLIRFEFFACGFIVCGFLASNYLLVPNTTHRPDTQVSVQSSQSSLADWRSAEARKGGRLAESAIVLPSIAQTAPTAERLAFERQLASNTVAAPTAPILAQAEPGITNARAEMTEASPQRRLVPQRVAASKPKRRQVPRREIVVVERTPMQREFGEFFGGFFSN